MLMNILLQFQIILVLAAAQTFDQTVSTQFLITGNFSDSQNVLVLITSESNKYGNYFHFKSVNSASSSFITAQISTVSPSNMRFALSTKSSYRSHLIMRPTNQTNLTNFQCTKNEFYPEIVNIDCINQPETPSCYCLRQSNFLFLSSSFPLNCTSQSNDYCNCIKSFYNPIVVQHSGNPPSYSSLSCNFSLVEDQECTSGCFNVSLNVIQNFDYFFDFTAQILNVNVSALENCIVGVSSIYFFDFSIGTSLNYAINSYFQKIYDNPLMNQVYNYTQSVDDIIDDGIDYGTIVKTQFVSHDYPSPLYCKYKLNYTGFVRYVGINDQRGESHSQPDGATFDSINEIYSENYFLLRPGVLNTIVILGYQINHTELNFDNCVLFESDINTITPQFSYYYYNDTIMPSKIVTGSNKCMCSSNCVKCISSRICLKCNQNTFLFNKTCVTNCPRSAPYQSLSRCTQNLVTQNIFIMPPIINESNIYLSGYLDYQSVNTFVATFHVSDQMILSSLNKTWANYSLPSSLSRSHSIIFTTYSGYYNFSIDLEIVSMDGIEGSEISNLIFYPIDKSAYYNIGEYSWMNFPIIVNSTSVMQSFTSSLRKVGKFYYLNRQLTYQYEFFLECQDVCQIRITTDGIISLYVDDILLIFEFNFINRWTYLIPKNFTGLSNIKFVAKRVFYLSINVDGENDVFNPNYPILSTSLTFEKDLPGSCIINNCLSCFEYICNSCEVGYYLTTDKSACVLDCGPSKVSKVERICLDECDNNRFSINQTDCIPICVEPGAFYSYENGITICVDECKFCKNIDTCSKCKYDNELNTDTFCFRKTGDLFSQNPDFSGPLEGILIADFNKTYMAVLSDQGVFQDKMFYFNKTTRKIPRIITAKKIIPINSTTGVVGFPAIPLAESGNITLHYIEIERNDDPLVFSISAFEDLNFMQWPLYQPDSIVSPLNIKLAYVDPDRLPQNTTKYTSVVISKVYEHNYPTDIFCSISVNYSGYIRGIYLNGELVYYDSQNNNGVYSETYRVSKIIPKKIFKADGYNLLTMFVSNFFFDGIQFVNCYDESHQILDLNTIEFRSYLLTGVESTPNQYQIINNTDCSAGCIQCLNYTYCLKCDIDLYLENGVCNQRCQSPNPIYGPLRDCIPALQSLAYRGSVSSRFSGTTFTTQWNLPYDESVMFIWHTVSGILTSSNFKVLQSTSVAYTLGESQTSMIYFNRSQINLFGFQNLLYRLTRPSQSIDTSFTTALYTLRNDSLLLYFYAGIPTLNNSNMALDFEYVSSHNNSFQFNADYEYRFKFYLVCSSTCNIQFNLNGYIQVFKNESTILFEGYVETYFPEITILRNLTGVNLITFIVNRATFFNYNIVGTYSVLTYQDLIAFDVFQTTSTTSRCYSPLCQNCFSTTCFSCLSGSNFYLYPVNLTCLNSCPSGLSGIQGQKLCGSTNCIDIGMIPFKQNCIFNCVEGKFWSIENGCTRNCNATCKSCGGPLPTDCISCSWPLVFNPSNNTCICPIGSRMNSTFGCDSTSYISIILPPAIQTCIPLQIQAIIDPSEASANNILFTWTLINSSASAANQETIRDYLASQSSRIIFIPEGMLQQNNNYNFSCSYTNSLSLIVSAWSETVTSIDSYPQAVIDGGLNQILNSGILNRITLLVSYSTCLTLTEPLKIQWNYEDGFLLDPNDFFDSKAPLYLKFPQCTLQPLTTTNLSARIWLESTPQYFTIIPLNLIIGPEIFSANILNGNRYQPIGYNLTVSGKIEYESNCDPMQGTVYYLWSCTYDDGTPCNDSMGVLNKFTANNIFNFSSEDFKNTTALNLYLTISKNGRNATTTTQIAIAPSNALVLSIACTSCTIYSPNSQDYFFTVQMISPGQLSQLNLNWTITPSVRGVRYATLLKIMQSFENIDSSFKNLIIEAHVSNSTNFGYAYLSIPINTPPSNGNISVFPLTGYSMSTYFLISAFDWTDTDIPIKYQYYYSLFPTENFNALLTDYQITTSTSTLLPGKNTFATIYILVSVRDNYLATSTKSTSVKVSSSNMNLQDCVTNFQKIVNSLSDTDPFQKAKTISFLTSELAIWENSTNSGSSSNNPCPTCSGHGSCTNTKCVCNSGWTFYDCSLTEQLYSELLNLKISLLQKLQNSYDALPIDSMKTIVFNTLEIISNNIDFNNNKSLTLIESILDSSLKVTNQNTTLSTSQAQAVATILSNILSYISYYDCKSQTNFTVDTVNKTEYYLDAISKGLLASKIPNETATILTTEAYALLSQKVSICDLNSLSLYVNSNTPETILKYSSSNLNCSQILNLQLYAFDSNLMTCNNSNGNKTYNSISIKITDNKGQDVKLNMTVIIKFPPNDLNLWCTENCDIIGDFCSCDDVSIFDVRYQLQKIFFASTLIKIRNISELLNFDYTDVPAFWAMIVFIFWLIISQYLVIKVVPKYDIILNYKKDLHMKTNLHTFWIALVCVHPLLSVFCIGEFHEIPKTVRVFLYFVRNVLIMTFTAIFGSAGGNDDLLSRVINFSPYLFILPYFTIFPLEGFLEWLLHKPSNKTIKEKEFPPKLIRYIQKRYKIGVFVTSIVMVVCIAIDLTIAASSTYESRMEWAADIIKSIIQDTFITPFLYMMSQFVLLKVFNAQTIKDKPKLKRAMSLYINSPLFSLTQISRNQKTRIFPIEKKNTLTVDTDAIQELYEKRDSNTITALMTPTSPAGNPLFRRVSSLDRAFDSRKDSGSVINFNEHKEFIETNSVMSREEEEDSNEESKAEPKIIKIIPSMISINSSEFLSYRDALASPYSNRSPLIMMKNNEENQQIEESPKQGISPDQSISKADGDIKIENFQDSINELRKSDSGIIDRSNSKIIAEVSIVRKDTKSTTQTFERRSGKDLTQLLHAYRPMTKKLTSPKNIGKSTKPSSFKTLSSSSNISSSNELVLNSLTTNLEQSNLNLKLVRSIDSFSDVSSPLSILKKGSLEFDAIQMNEFTSMPSFAAGSMKPETKAYDESLNKIQEIIEEEETKSPEKNESPGKNRLIIEEVDSSEIKDEPEKLNSDEVQVTDDQNTKEEQIEK